MQTVEVLVILRVTEADLNRIRSVDARLKVIDARGWFDAEIRDSRSQWTVQRYLGNRQISEGSRQERDRLLESAEIIIGGWPPPLDLRSRAPRLRWFHQIPAGVSNLLGTDLWGSDVIVTTSRGHGNTRPMAEYVLATFLYFSRGLHMAYRDRQRHEFDHRSYSPILLSGKTACIVGAGGIGQDVARLCTGVGMRVVGTRRQIKAGTPLPAGFTRLENAGSLHGLLSQSDFVAICCQWTPETTKLIGRQAFAAMKEGAVLVNVARGEIVDEEALIAALAEDKLRGVGLDVYEGEFERAPDRRLWDNERVLITPHVSAGRDASDDHRLDVFCANARAYLNGRPMINVVDWERGY
jgi:phosphoglycerate dehydrogenase-like enzyme